MTQTNQPKTETHEELIARIDVDLAKHKAITAEVSRRHEESLINYGRLLEKMDSLNRDTREIFE